MNYEKKYKEALERAKRLYEQGTITESLNYVFHELAESEDEKIRKEMLQIAKESEDSFYMVMTPNKREKLIAWLEKQGEHSIYNVPSREVILAIWDLGNEWKELTNGSISTEHGTQLDYIQKHWHESEYYMNTLNNFEL